MELSQNSSLIAGTASCSRGHTRHIPMESFSFMLNPRTSTCTGAISRRLTPLESRFDAGARSTILKTFLYIRLMENWERLAVLSLLNATSFGNAIVVQGQSRNTGKNALKRLRRSLSKRKAIVIGSSSETTVSVVAG